MANPSLNIDDELLDAVDGTLSYGDSRSAWVRQAMRLKLAVDPILEDADLPEDEEERREFVVEAVEAALED